MGICWIIEGTVEGRDIVLEAEGLLVDLRCCERGSVILGREDVVVGW